MFLFPCLKLAGGRGKQRRGQGIEPLLRGRSSQAFRKKRTLWARTRGRVLNNRAGPAAERGRKSPNPLCGMATAHVVGRTNQVSFSCTEPTSPQPPSVSMHLCSRGSPHPVYFLPTEPVGSCEDRYSRMGQHLRTCPARHRMALC